MAPRRTLLGRVAAPRSRRGSLNLLLEPSMLTLMVTRVSGLVGDVEAMVGEFAVVVVCRRESDGG